MARQMRAVAPVVDTSMDRITPMSSPGYSQTISPVGSLIATPAVSPEPAYIAAREAGQIITREVLVEFHMIEDADLSELHESSFAQISDTALVTVNMFLDRILHNILATSRSLSLANLRTAVKEVLKPRLAAEAIGGADEELVECIGEDDEVDLFEDATEIMDGSFDLDLVWKRARLRCMVYTRLGDMEEDDEERYIEDHGLDGFVDGRRMSRNNGLVSPPVAIWLTAILEFIGEHALIISTSSAYRRCEIRYGRGLAGQPLHPSVVTVGDGDLEKIALNPTLGRLWRAWRKPLKSPRSSIGRALSIESMRHRRGDSRSSIGLGRKGSSETLGSVREPQHDQDKKLVGEKMRQGSVTEEPEVSKDHQVHALTEGEAHNQEQGPEGPEGPEEPQEPKEPAAEVDLEPAEIPLPMSEYDVDEIEVPGYTHNPDLAGRAEDLTKSKRPTSMAFVGASNPASIPETLPTRGPRHMRSQSLPGVRRPSAFTLLAEERPNVTEVLESAQDTKIARSSAERPLSGATEGEVFSSLKSPSDYQTPDQAPAESTIREKRRSRRNRASFVPPADRKSAVSEFGGSEGPTLFDRSDYRVDPNESQTVEAAMMTPKVTAATPTDLPGTPTSGPIRSGLRSNRPVSLAINSPNKLAAPRRTATGEVSPVVDGEYLDSGEVSPLEPSDDEGSVSSIAGLKDAKEHMGVDPAEESVPDSGPYEDAFEEQAVSPMSPEEPFHPAQQASQAYFSPPAPQIRRDAAPVTAAVVAGGTAATVSRSKHDEPMVRQASDERRRQAALVSPRRSGESEKDDLPSIPKDEQIKQLAAAAWVHSNVAVPKPEKIYRSMSEDMTDEGPIVGASVTSPSALQTAPVLNSTAPATTAIPAPVPAPVSNVETVPTSTPITRIHRKEVSTDSTGPAQSLGGVTPLQLQQNSVSEMAMPPPASKLLERRRQLPQVDTTATPERAGVQRLTASPQSADGGLKQLPPRSVPDQTYTTPASMPRESTPPAQRRPASRKTSKSGDDAFGHKSSASKSINSINNNEKSKDFEQLIDSGETIQYTLTPQNIRSYKVEAPPESVPMQASNSRDRPRGLSITGGFGGRTKSNPQVSTAGTVVGNVSKPAFAGIPVRRPPQATTTAFVSPRASKSGLAPREAKTDMGSIRDFAEFMRTTGPSDNGDFDSTPHKVVRGPKPVQNTDIRAKPQTAGLPSGMRSPTGALSVSSSIGSKRKGPKLQARDPQINDRSTSDLIDFIREGPPSDAGSHRIPRTVAPFRTTMDSDDMKNGVSAHANVNGYGRYTNSLNSTQESFKTASGISSSNSHTGLLASARANGNASSNMGGVEEEPMMPTRKSRKPRDPYSIDFSDDEDYDNDDRLDTPRENGHGGHRREESLVEFLQSQLPPASNPTHAKQGGGGARSSLGRPIGNGPGMARPKQQARAAMAGGRSDTNDLADFFKNTPPPGGSISSMSSQPTSKEKKGGIGGMFRRARG